MSTDPVTSGPPHPCMVCGASACFGFNTNRGDVWTRQAHPDAGRAVVVAPGPMARVTGATRG